MHLACAVQSWACTLGMVAFALWTHEYLLWVLLLCSGLVASQCALDTDFGSLLLSRRPLLRAKQGHMEEKHSHSRTDSQG